MRHIADGADHIHLALGATNFRKQQNGLAALVALKFKLDPHSSTNVFLFCNKRRNSLRALRWYGNGFILVTKSLSDEMKFQWSKSQGEVRDITIIVPHYYILTDKFYRSFMGAFVNLCTVFAMLTHEFFLISINLSFLQIIK